MSSRLMCYLLLLSTTSGEDFSTHNNELVHFSRDLPATAVADSLCYANRWTIGSMSGCSCTFRHLHSVELGFAEPVDWYPEEEEEIEATLQLIRIIRCVVLEGHAVDCVDVWQGHDAGASVVSQLDVDLGTVTDSAFRFFENYHFKFLDSKA